MAEKINRDNSSDKDTGREKNHPLPPSRLSEEFKQRLRETPLPQIIPEETKAETGTTEHLSLDDLPS